MIEKYFPGFTLDVVTDLLYTSVLQSRISVANYWHEPFDRLRYEREVTFLPVLDNLVLTNSSQRYKQNFLRLEKMALFGSPQDGDLAPWQTSLFSFLDSNNTIQNLTHFPYFKEDTFGLKTLYQAGKIDFRAIEGVPHSHWLTNETNFINNVLPYLN